MKDFVGFKTQFAECIANTSEYTETKKRIVLMRCECGKEFKTSTPNLKSTSPMSCGCRNTKGTKLPVSGDKFGKLTYKSIGDGVGVHGKQLHRFICSCGTEKQLELNPVFTGNTTSCGCDKKLRGIEATNKLYAGKKYNMLTFIRHAEKWASKQPGKVPIAVWKCDCGKETEIRIADVRYGKTTCCGCATGRDGGQARVGNRHGILTLTEILPKRDGNLHGRWKCDCGNEIDRLLTYVENSKSTPSCGCLMSSLLREKRGFTLNESVFETITDDSAYWLGFLLADGNVSENTITLNLKTGDTEHLEKFRTFMGGNQTISVKKDIRMSGYAFGSIKVAKDLAGWGIVPNKSLIAKPHKDLINNRHFWRGMIDGDGTLYKDRNGLGLCGTEAVCQGFLDFAKTIISTKAHVRKCKANLWNIGISCGRSYNVGLLIELYENAPTYLTRKHARAITAISNVRGKIKA